MTIENILDIAADHLDGMEYLDLNTLERALFEYLEAQNQMKTKEWPNRHCNCGCTIQICERILS